MPRPILRLTGGAALAVLSGIAACETRTRDRDAEPPAQAGTAGAEKLASSVLDDGEHLAMPGDIVTVGDHLILIDSRADSLVHVYGLQSGARLLSFGRKGRGPGEFEGPWFIDPVPGSRHAFHVHDIALQRLTRIDLERDFEPVRNYGGHIISLRGGGAATGPVWIGDSVFVSPGYFSAAGRLGHFARSGQMIRVVGEPPPGGRDIPFQVRQQAYQSTARPNPDRTLIAVATRYADRLEIFRPDGTLAARAERPAGFEPVYEVVQAGGTPAMNSGDELRFGYVDLATTERHVYALYSGLRRADAPGRANFGRQVRVFDWKGKLLRILELDDAVFNIAADEADRHLFAVRIEPVPALVVFKLEPAAPPRR